MLKLYSMKKQRLVVTILYLIFLLASNYHFSFAGETLREKIIEKRKERLMQRLEKSGGRILSFTLKHDGIAREYDVRLPRSYSPETPMAVVFYFHGGGGSKRAAYRDGVDTYADKFGFILVVPSGTGPFKDKLFTWNSGRWSGWISEGECCGHAGKNNIDDVGFISKVIDEVRGNFSVDENRVYAMGISNGAMMSYRLACELPDKIAAVAAVAPPAVPGICSSSVKPVPIIHIHGTADPCSLYNGGECDSCAGSKGFVAQSASEMISFWLKKNGCLEQRETVYAKGAAVCLGYQKCIKPVEFCAIEGGGHTWPSGAQYAPASKIGQVSYDISFDQIWDFFKDNPKTLKQRNSFSR